MLLELPPPWHALHPRNPWRARMIGIGGSAGGRLFTTPKISWLRWQLGRGLGHLRLRKGEDGLDIGSGCRRGERLGSRPAGRKVRGLLVGRKGPRIRWSLCRRGHEWLPPWGGVGSGWGIFQRSWGWRGFLCLFLNSSYCYLSFGLPLGLSLERRSPGHGRIIRWACVIDVKKHTKKNVQVVNPPPDDTSRTMRGKSDVSWVKYVVWFIILLFNFCCYGRERSTQTHCFVSEESRRKFFFLYRYKTYIIEFMYVLITRKTRRKTKTEKRHRNEKKNPWDTKLPGTNSQP